MKIDFVASNQNIAVGSYRIWIHDAVPTLAKQGVSARIIKDVSQSRPDAVLIFSKGDYRLAAKLKNEKRLMGGINVPASEPCDFLDFVIVGSPEEKASLMPTCKNVFIVNLIEKMYEGQPLKNHDDTNNLVLGYHGSCTHIEKLKLTGFMDAFLGIYQKQKSMKFVTLTSDPKTCGTILSSMGFPTGSYENRKWSYQTVLRDISQFDVGIVPNMTDIMAAVPQMKTLVSTDDGLYKTDFCVRYKNKSNAGRAFVFVQLGIPVITDFTPSNMPMFHDETCGVLVSNAAGYQVGIERFLDAKERNKTAGLAYNKFMDLYSPYNDWTNVVKKLKAKILEHRLT